MGLIGILTAVVIMVLGVGYLFFGTSGAPITVTNDSLKAPIGEELAEGESAIDTTRDVKNLVEQNAAEVSEQLTNNLPTGQAGNQQEAADSKQVTVDNQQKAGELKIENRLMSAGFSVPAKPRRIDTIVLHSSYDLLGKDPYSVSGVIKEYEDYGVSAHYLIDRKGAIYRLVEDKNIAYHAGVSKMPDGRQNANDFSIGIEMLNTEKGQFTSAQYAAVNNLIASLKKQYPIKSVVGHSDIAPGRKTDPWNFDWKKLK
ncbi:MAG: N-acetylmuramoyl-L-alanine amidase [bacterium]|nr:N-acetylmuramoyl-L-alanine amidase [bacterium]